MSPHSTPYRLDNEAISGIMGSVSISFWIIVFMPQIYENYYRKSSEGLSLLFVVLWLAGDVFNVLGAVLQHVLPTMIILAIYYTLADVVLLGQIFVYGDGSKNVDYVHLNPSNPLNEDIFDEIAHDVLGETDSESQESEQQGPGSSSTQVHHHSSAEAKSKKKTHLKKFIESSLVILVVLAGVIGWYISYDPTKKPSKPNLTFDPLAQFFGWLSAVLYLGSRMPQILLNFQRKSCDGISFLFFLCAVMGNLTYVISILAISIDPYFLLVQSSWLAGSIGTLILDFIIFVQFFVYNENDEYEAFDEPEEDETDR